MVNGAGDEPLAGEGSLGHPLALLAVSLVALGLLLLPAAVGVAILLGRTVPPEFGVGAVLAIAAGIKFGAAAWGIGAAIGTPRPVKPAAGCD